MAAYAIGYATLRSTEWQKEYGAHMPALTAKHGGNWSKSAPQALEGAPVLPEAMVVIEFLNRRRAGLVRRSGTHPPEELRQGGAISRWCWSARRLLVEAQACHSVYIVGSD
jgi:uncharacterized protein (DUF1330 family)